MGLGCIQNGIIFKGYPIDYEITPVKRRGATLIPVAESRPRRGKHDAASSSQRPLGARRMPIVHALVAIDHQRTGTNGPTARSSSSRAVRVQWRTGGRSGSEDCRQGPSAVLLRLSDSQPKCRRFWLCERFVAAWSRSERRSDTGRLVVHHGRRLNVGLGRRFAVGGTARPSSTQAG